MSDCNGKNISRLFANLFLFRGDIKKQTEGLKIEFLVDTGANKSVINYQTFKAISEFQKLVLNRPNRPTIAANGTSIDMFGITDVTLTFDSDNKFPILHTMHISGKKGISFNILGMDFLSKTSNSICLDKPLLKLDSIYPGKFIRLNTERNIGFPYFAKIRSVRIGHKETLPAKTISVIKIPQCVDKGTSFVPHHKLTKSGIFFFDSYCTAREKDFPIMIENMNSHDVTLSTDEFVGYLTCETYDPSNIFNLENGAAFIDKVNSNGFIDINQITFSSMPPWAEYRITDKDNAEYDTDMICKLQQEMPVDFSEEAHACDPARKKETTRKKINSR